MRTIVDKKMHLPIIYIVGIISAIYVIVVVGPLTSGDSITYIKAWDSISRGNIDIMRTPVYPAILALIRFIVGKAHMMVAIIILQHIIALIALKYFYKTILDITNSERISFWTTLALSCLPYFTAQNNYIMTESLAMSGSIFLVACAVAIYEGNYKRNIPGFTFWLFFLVFLRPSFIYLLPVFAVSFALMLWLKPKMRRQSAICIIVILIASGSLIAYMSAFQKTYGVFTSSEVSEINDFFIMRQSGSLDPDKSTNKALGSYIKNSYDKDGIVLYGFENYNKVYNTTDYAFSHWDLPTIHQVVHDSKSISKQIKGIAFRTYYAGFDLLLCCNISTIFEDLNISIGWIYLLLIFYALLLFHQIRKGKEFPWTSLLLLMLGASNLIVAIVGASIWVTGEWGRLVYPSRFIFLIMLIQLIQSAVLSIRSGKRIQILPQNIYKKRNSLLIIYILGGISTVFMIFVVGPRYGGDSASYINSWKHFSSGLIDNDRLPSYAYIIGLAQTLGGDVHRDFFILLIQNIIAYISLGLYYSIVFRATNSRKISLWTTLIIALLPFYTSWHNVILTESLSMSGLLFLVYHIVAIYDGRSRWNLLGFGFWLLFLTFLKPALIYIIPVSAVAFLIMLYQKRKQWISASLGLVITVCVTFSMLAYMNAYKKTYGVFASSRVGALNAYFNMRNNCTLDPSKATDKSLAKYISNSYKKYGNTPFSLSDSILWVDSYYPYEHWNFPAYSQVVKASLRENPAMQVKGAIRRLYYSGKGYLLNPAVSTPLAIFNFSIGWLYLLMIVYAIWIFYQYKKKRHLPLASFILLMLGASHIIVTILGAQGEWGRLLCPPTALYILMAMQIFQVIISKSSRNHNNTNIKITFTNYGNKHK